MKANFFVYALLNDDENERTEKYEAEWNGYWQFVNVMQFLNSFVSASVIGLNQMVYRALPVKDDAEQPLDQSAYVWQGTMKQELDETTLTFAKKCIELGIPEPSSVGYELVGDNGSIIAESELAWETKRIAFITSEQAASEGIFLANGWVVIKADDKIKQSLFKEAE